MVEQIQEAPRRGRPPRAQEVATHRRRRRAGTLNRMAQFKLDCIEPEDLDLANYVYRWIDDAPGNLRRATQLDDYDFVTASELGEGFDPAMTDSESTDRVRMIVNQPREGVATYAYLCKKRRDFWNEDNEEMVRMREAMMAGRVYNAEGIEQSEGSAVDRSNFFSTPDAQLGHAGERRRGPIPRTA